MSDFDITQSNIAVERLLEVTENPRHRFLLQTYNRHRYLEMAGRYKLEPEDVLTADQAGELLAPLIKPLPSFDEAVPVT